MLVRLFTIMCIFVSLDTLGSKCFGQCSVSLDHVDGLYGSSLDGSDTLQTGVTITFYIRFSNNSGLAMNGTSNGFRIFSTDGATWTPLSYASTGTLEPGFDFGVSVTPFSNDGAGADTIGIYGLRGFGSGMVNGFDNIVLTISTQLNSSQDGRTLILDSCKFSAGGYWLWNDANLADVIPSWDGPHAFAIANPITTLNVTNTNDAGAGSLRWALMQANTQMGQDSIIFEISGAISLLSQLPALIDDSTMILGSSSPGGYNSVILDGSSMTVGDGLVVQSRDNVIEGLTIRNFPGIGITVNGELSIRNRLTRNLLYNNSSLAIDLGPDGVTGIDVGDLDTGPNTLLNHPVVDSIVANPDSTFAIYGRATDSANVEFYVAHPAEDDSRPEDPSGYGEAYFYIGSDTCGMDSAFVLLVPKTVAGFSRITAIGTDKFGNSSEFGLNFALVPSPLIVVANSNPTPARKHISIKVILVRIGAADQLRNDCFRR